MSDEYLVWVDVETTGLNPRTDHLLEIAVIITNLDASLNFGKFRRTIFHPKWLAKAMRAEAVKFVRDMHDKTGLWDRLPQGENMATVDEELLEFIKDVVPEPRKARLAGNSVRLDLNFLEECLRQTYAHLHYRSVDVSALAYVMADCWGVVDGHFEKKKTHDAMDDIEESIAEYKWLQTRAKDLLKTKWIYTI